MPTVDVTAVAAHNALVSALTLSMYRPTRKAGVADPLIAASATALNAAIAATNAATQNPANSQAVAFQYRKLTKVVKGIGNVLGVRRRHSQRSARRAAMLLAAIHTVNTP